MPYTHIELSLELSVCLIQKMYFEMHIKNFNRRIPVLNLMRNTQVVLENRRKYIARENFEST